MSSTRWKVLWNTGAQVVGRVVGAGTTFVVSLVIARSFGAQGYGDFAKVTTFVAFFYLLADFGMNAVYLQKIRPSASSGQAESSWGELLGVRAVGSIVLMFIAMAILVFLPQGMTQGYTALVRMGIIIFLPTILFQALITTTNAQFQRILRYDLATKAIVAGAMVTLAGMWALAVSPFGNIGVFGGIGVIVGGTLVSAVVALFLVKKTGSMLRPAINRTSLLSYFTQSLPLGMTLIFNLIYFRADHLILTLSRSTAEVGIYGLAYKVFEFPLAVPTFFMNSVYPLLLAQQTQSSPPKADQPLAEKLKTQKFQNLIWKSGIFLLIASLLLLIAFWNAAPLLSNIRSDFLESIPVLRVLSFGLPFFFLSSLTMWTLIAIKKQHVLVAIYGISMLLNIVLNLKFIPIHGYMAAAWVTVGSEGLVLLVSSLYLRRLIHYSPELSQKSTNGKSTNKQMNDGMLQ